MEPWVWIVIAIVALVIIALIVVAMRKKSAGAKRDRAAELRREAAEKDLSLRERQAAAAKTQANAQAAEAEAKRRAAEAQERAVESERLSAEARSKSEAYQEARAERDEKLRRADEIDPDVGAGRDSAERGGRHAAVRRDQGADGAGRHAGMGDRVHDKVDDVRGRRDADGDGRRG